MFGLLTQRPREPALRADFKKNYCGTCKAIGTMYGHKQRLLLNYDVVFLSEILSALSNRPADFKAISVGRCLSLPGQQADLPPFLSFTASINLLLASIKIQDNIQDSGFVSVFCKALALLQKMKFSKARLYLEQDGLNVPLVDACVAAQGRRERQRKHFYDVQAGCRYYAEMTGSVSGEIFRHAARTAGKPEAAEDMFQIGKAYGEMVYLSDALKDYEKDLKRGTFNPFLTGTARPSLTIPQEAANSVYQHISSNMLIIRCHLFRLPIADDKKQSFAARMEGSIYASIFPVSACTSKHCHEPAISLYQKYRHAYARVQKAYGPANHGWFSIALKTIGVGLISLVLLLMPFSVFASSSAPAPQNECCQDCGDECCNCCCDACCDSICNASR